MKDWNELYATITYATEKKDYTRLLYSFGFSESQQVKNNAHLGPLSNISLFNIIPYQSIGRKSNYTETKNYYLLVVSYLSTRNA